MHKRNNLSFWQHHALTTMLAIPLLSIARLIGRMAEIGDAPNIILHSAILVAFAHPLQIAGAYGTMRYLPKRIPLSWRAIAGCVLVAPIAAILSPIISWFVGVGPPPIIAAAGREELSSEIAARYPFILAGYAVLGTMIWMSLNFTWWRRALAEGEASERSFEDSRRTKDVEEEATHESPPVHFLSKLPFSKRGDLWALSSELHYVRVYTSIGNDLVLMRLSDAIEQAEGLEGLRVHRSHWVARDGIASISTVSGRMSIILKNNAELPVSRSYQGAVRNAFGDLIG